MAKLPLRINRKLTRLEEGYIGISHYFRERFTLQARHRPQYSVRHRSVVASPKFLGSFSLINSCEQTPKLFIDGANVHGSPTSSSNSTSFCQAKFYKTDAATVVEEDSTVPTPAPVLHTTGALDEVARGQTSGEGETTHILGSDGEMQSARISKYMSDDPKTVLYQYMHSFDRASHGWQNILRGQLDVYQNGEQVHVNLHGFITRKEGLGAGDGKPFFLRLVDPHLRHGVQLVVNRSPTSTQTRDLSSAEPGVGNDTMVTRADFPAPQTQGSSDDIQLDPAPVHGQDGMHSNIFTPASSTEKYRKLRPHTPVVVKGIVAPRPLKDVEPRIEDGGLIRRVQRVRTPEPRLAETKLISDPYVGTIEELKELEIHVTSIAPLNNMPPSIIAKSETKFPPEKRYLELRTKYDLRHAIRLRSWAKALISKFMFIKGFDEIETPVLFKSTPEGAREFVVPTRSKGFAYALPQSPQQHKQLLMASGFSRYFQFAKCFRDEDMRTDRQPEFTQVDMEMSFASRLDVMSVIEDLIQEVLWPKFFPARSLFNGVSTTSKWENHIAQNITTRIPVMKHIDAMLEYGSDKPDVRLGSKIKKVDKDIPPELTKMLSPLKQPIIEIVKIPMHGTPPQESSRFITNFLEAPSSAVFLNNPAGPPGITVYDLKKPLQGLAAFGHDCAEKVVQLLNPESGDIFILQARSWSSPLESSTPLGNMRRDVYLAALEKGLVPALQGDSMLWIVDFPLFSKANDSDPGQSGRAGICSTHHPFTAPATLRDFQLLGSDPLKAKGDHFDLVINGIEVGGGSRRIHDSKLQRYILEDILRMPKERVKEFDHLLNALEAGCPPHAGFALGFDRLMTILAEQKTIRDVIAFPKWGQGEDRMVGAPSKLSAEQLRTYHLALRG